jgi:hypothetical protein
MNGRKGIAMNENDEFFSEEGTDEELDELIEAASKKLHLDFDWVRHIAPEEVQYLLDHCPFLQLIDPSSEFSEPLQQIEAVSGWVIHDYGNAMSSSPGRFLMGGGNFRILLEGEEDEEGGGGPINPGKGSIYKQAIDTAQQMIELAIREGWEGIQIVDGHPLMKRAAWIAACHFGYNIRGYMPTDRDEAIRARIELDPQQLEELLKEIKKPGPQFGGK